MVAGIFFQRIILLKSLPFYMFSSFKACTKFLKGKDVREHIVKIIKNESQRVLEDCDSQSRNAGTCKHLWSPRSPRQFCVQRRRSHLINSNENRKGTREKSAPRETVTETCHSGAPVTEAGEGREQSCPAMTIRSQ